MDDKNLERLIEVMGNLDKQKELDAAKRRQRSQAMRESREFIKEVSELLDEPDLAIDDEAFVDGPEYLDEVVKREKGDFLEYVSDKLGREAYMGVKQFIDGHNIFSKDLRISWTDNDLKEAVDEAARNNNYVINGPVLYTLIETINTILDEKIYAANTVASSDISRLYSNLSERYNDKLAELHKALDIVNIKQGKTHVS